MQHHNRTCYIIPIIADYIETIHCEVVRLRKDFGTLKKAKCHAKELLPKEPASLVEKYTKGTARQPKAEVIAKKYSRFTKPAYPVDKEHPMCDCSGKCATVRCPCKKALEKCTEACGCKTDLCSNK